MAGYSTSNPPVVVWQGITGNKMWLYQSVDAGTAVDASGYFTDGYNLGMRAGDIVIVQDTDATYKQTTMHVVVSASTTAVDLSDGVSVGGAANAD